MKTYPIQETQAQIFGMEQSKANQCIQLLLPMLEGFTDYCLTLEALLIWRVPE